LRVTRDHEIAGGLRDPFALRAGETILKNGFAE
jgi:hypothetical protein